MKVFTIKDTRIRHMHPSTNAAIKGMIFKNFEIEVDRVVEGEEIQGNSKWYADNQDGFYWSGGLEEHGEVDSPQPDAIATAGSKIGASLQAFSIPDLWLRTKGSGVRVAILDTGIVNHTDLKSVSGAKDFYHQDNACPDGDGHGTHCVGILAAQGIRKVSGVAPDCEVFIGRTNKNTGNLKETRLVEGLKWASEMCKADIISISAGLFDDFDIVRQAIEKIDPRKTIIVAAIGNNGERGPNAGLFPARYENCISVGAVDNGRKLLDQTDRAASLTICAPGFNIESTAATGDYEIRSGTSMATPFVSGVLALLIAHIRKNSINMSFSKLKQVLVKNAFELQTVDGFSYKVINPLKSLTNIKSEE